MMCETCETCGQELHVGAWPWCPHDVGSVAVEPDEWPGGKVFENGFDRPTRFYSKTEYLAALKARGLMIKAKYAGDGFDKHLTNWAAGIDAKTLDNVRVLLSRGSVVESTHERERLEQIKAEFPIEVRKVEL